MENRQKHFEVRQIVGWSSNFGHFPKDIEGKGNIIFFSLKLNEKLKRRIFFFR